MLLLKNKEYKDLEIIIHSNQGSLYSSKESNKFLHLYNIIHFTSKPDTHIENCTMETINVLIKEKYFFDFKLNLIYLFLSSSQLIVLYYNVNIK